ncbi:MAG: response regulator [Blastocatellia bacterium]|nr:response regulator [Blastocatellia bacterium]
MKTILVHVQDETLMAVIAEIVNEMSVKMLEEADLALQRVEKVEEISPLLIITEFLEEDTKITEFFKLITENESTSHIPFMFLIPDAAKWNEIAGFRLGFDTKVTKERPKLGIQLRLQALLKKGVQTEVVSNREKEIQQLMQSIITKKKPEESNSGMFPAVKLGRAKLLVVEDEPMTRSVLQTALENTYDLIFASDGQRGLEMARSEQPDLIVSDLMMPVMDGLEFLQKLRATEEMSETPFLFLTARAGVEDKIEGLEHGADEYLGKPFSVRELQLRVERLVEEGRRRKGSTGAFQGKLSEVPLSDIIQLLSNNRKTGELSIELPSAKERAKVFFQDGQIVNAVYGKATGQKGLYRMFAIEDGKFIFENKPPSVKKVINERTENLLLDGYRQIDEIEMLRSRFATDFATILRPGTEKALHTGLSTIDALVLFAVSTQATVKEVIDKVSYTDYEVLESVIELLESRLLTDGNSP